MGKQTTPSPSSPLKGFPRICPQPNREPRKNAKSIARKQSLFQDVCDEIKPQSILEVGSWMGASAIAWKDASKSHNIECKVYCIDTWLGSPEHYLSSAGDEWGIEKLSINEKGPQFFEDFLVNIHEAYYGDYILPMRADSHSALSYLKNMSAKFDVIYIDGAHDEIAVFRDTTLASQLLASGGAICGDDFGWQSVRTGLLLAAYDQSMPKISILRKGGDFIIVPRSNRQLRNAFIRKGYTRWHPLTQVHKLIRFAGKKLLHAATKV